MTMGKTAGLTRFSRTRLTAALILLAGAACTRGEDRPVEPAPPRAAPAEVLRADYPAPIGPVPPAIAAHETGEIRRHDSLSTALARLHVSAAEVDALAHALRGVLDLKSCRVGDVFTVDKDAEGRLMSFRYAAGPTTVAMAYRGSDGVLHGLLEPVRVVTRAALVEGRIAYSLYGAMEEAGEQPQLALGFVDLFSWDVDFFTESQENDAFRILVEKRFVDGKMIGYGRILGAEYAMASGRTLRAFYYTGTDGQAGYYGQDGGSVRKAFLKSPIQFASITSRFGMRKHPILNYVGAHHGVDYGAPMGTAVWAVGDGVVVRAGPAGGYGNMVAIRHPNGLETRYAHLRAFGSGIHAGKHVQQKQVIGFVGSTGLSTGPHLHFEVLRGGKWMNPLAVALPPAPPIPDAEKETFATAIRPYVERLDAAGRAMAQADAPEPAAAAE